jgi:tRNA(Arg) A34 adenosine deaminase TadA
MNQQDKKFMKLAIKLSFKGVLSGKGGPFGAVIVKNGKVIAQDHNRVTSTNDPTAHAEIVAIRKACKKLKTFNLAECELYTSCEPCPMCLGAIYWSHFKKVYFANTKKDAADIGFDDLFIYQEIERPIKQRRTIFKQIMRKEALAAFQLWKNKLDQKRY